MSGVGALNYSSDMDQFNVTNPLTENVNRAMMPPPPPMKPKNTKRIVTKFAHVASAVSCFISEALGKIS